MNIPGSAVRGWSAMCARAVIRYTIPQLSQMMPIEIGMVLVWLIFWRVSPRDFKPLWYIPRP